MARKSSSSFNRPENPHESRHQPVRAAVNFDLLSDEEKADIRRRAEERVLEREKQAAEERLLELEMLRVEKERNPEAFEEQKRITIDLAEYADRVVIDGRVFVAGQTYTVGKKLYDVIKEIEQRTFRHENEVRTGRTYDAPFRRRSDPDSKDGGAFATISARTGQVTRF